MSVGNYEINATKKSRKHCSSWHYSPKILFLATRFSESNDTIRPDSIH